MTTTNKFITKKPTGFFSSPKRVLAYIALIIFTLMWITPILIAIGTSLRTYSDILTRGGPFSMPEKLVLTNYQAAWERGANENMNGLVRQYIHKKSRTHFCHRG